MASQWTGMEATAVHPEVNGAAAYRFPAGLISVATGGLPGSGTGVESLVAASLPITHGIAPVTQLPHTPSPGQPTKAESDRDNPSDQ